MATRSTWFILEAQRLDTRLQIMDTVLLQNVYCIYMDIDIDVHIIDDLLIQ